MADKKVEKEVKCDCEKNCQCGCHEGKECSCNNECCCCKKKVFKILGLLIVFLAGMGFGELLNCGNCYPKAPRHIAPMGFHHKAPKYHDTQGGNVIIINTDGDHDEFKMDRECPFKKEMMKKKHERHFNKKEKHERVEGARPIYNGAAVK